MNDSVTDRTKNLLDRLEMVRGRGRGQWSARCPAHDDRDPSLSVTEMPDGRILIKCHAGCGNLDVLTSVGLEWSSLFPPKDNYRPVLKRPKDEAHERAVLAICAADRAAGKRLSKADKAREIEAWKRVRGGR